MVSYGFRRLHDLASPAIGKFPFGLEQEDSPPMPCIVVDTDERMLIARCLLAICF